ncbi:MAG: hypothetical protein GXP62_17100, partial [Oligoflexia bacterium]|nr:hypothetical protein [Oligoflexia bacterium]
MPSAPRLSLAPLLALFTVLLAAVLGEAPAHALDLALSFAGPKAASSSTTVQGVGAQQRLVAIEDGQGDRWVIELSAIADDATTVTVSGTARILEVNDPATVRHFQVTAQIGQPV